MNKGKNEEKGSAVKSTKSKPESRMLLELVPPLQRQVQVAFRHKTLYAFVISFALQSRIIGWSSLVVDRMAKLSSTSSSYTYPTLLMVARMHPCSIRYVYSCLVSFASHPLLYHTHALTRPDRILIIIFIEQKPRGRASNQIFDLQNPIIFHGDTAIQTSRCFLRERALGCRSRPADRFNHVKHSAFTVKSCQKVGV